MAPSFWWNCLCRFAGSILVMKQSLVSGFAGSTLVIKQSKKLVNCCWYRDIRHLRWRHQCKQGVLFGVDFFIYFYILLSLRANQRVNSFERRSARILYCFVIKTCWQQHEIARPQPWESRVTRASANGAFLTQQQHSAPDSLACVTFVASSGKARCKWALM